MGSWTDPETSIDAFEMLRIGVIGLGKMGVSHLSILCAHPDVQVVAVADSSSLVCSVVPKHLGITAFDDYRKMIDQVALDAVVVATPNRTHAEVAAYAIERDLHVFVEKPLCLDLDDGARLVRLANDHEIVSQVGYHNRFLGTFREARRIVQAGLLGQLYHVRGEAYGQVVLAKQGSTWRSKKSEGGGCLHDYCSHVVDLMDFVVGPPTQVVGAVLERIFSPKVEDAVYATLRYPNGVSGQIAVNWSDETYRKMSIQIVVQGTGGKLVVDRQECRHFVAAGHGTEVLPEGWHVRSITELQDAVWFYLRGEEYSSQADYFVTSVKQRNLQNENSFASALRTDELLHQIALASSA